MFRDYLCALGVVVSFGCGLSASAAEAPGETPSRTQAWAALTREPLEKDPALLSSAIIAIVRAAVPEDLDRLATYMQTDGFAEAFAIPSQLRMPTLGTCPFKELLSSIAECESSFAEELLVIYARRALDTERVPRDRVARLRRGYIFQALGHSRPKTIGTYSFLCREMSWKGWARGAGDLMQREGDSDAFSSLVSIGDDRAAEMLRREMFSDPQEWTRTPVLLLDPWVSDMAMARDKPANFALLFSLAQEARTEELQERILMYLVERQILRGSEAIIFKYPGYDKLPAVTRESMLKVVNAADRSKFSPKGLELLDRLKAMLKSQ